MWKGLPAVQMTKIVWQHLELVCGEGAIVPQHLVVTRSAGALDALVAQQVEISLSGMVDPLVHHRSCQSVPIPVLIIIRWEEPEQMKSFYHRQKIVKQKSTYRI